MNQVVKMFLKESVELELNVAELYQVFSVKFPEDYRFWWKISLEEMKHAALIESINDFFFPDTILSAGEIEQYNAELHRNNRTIKERIMRYKENSPSREEAFKCALELENSAGESHYEIFMTTELNSGEMAKIFQKLNGDDINHAKRMVKYMKDNKIADIS